MSRQNICPEWPEIRREEYKGVYVYAEHDGSSLKDVSLELIGKARQLAVELDGTEVAAIIIGGTDAMAKELIETGADRVIRILGEGLETYNPVRYSMAIAQVLDKYRPEIVLIGGTKRGRELAAYIANTLKTGITADCTELEIDKASRDLIAIRPTFGGNVLAGIRCPQRRPQMASVRPGVFPKPSRDPTRRGEVVSERVDVQDGRMRLVAVERKVERDVADLPPVEKADVVVVGGRGLGSADGFRLLVELARALDGTIGASLMAVRAGWAPHTRQVGQTGKTIRPRVYIGVGVSGAVQHIVGMLESKVIIAINTDRNAPIFRYVDYGIVGDYKEIIPRLIELVKAAPRPTPTEK